MQLYQKILILSTCLLLSISAAGQEDKNQSIREQIQTEKIAFFTEKIGLTLQEAEKFWPVYNEYWDKKNKIDEERKKSMNAYLNNPDNFSRKEIEELVDNYVDYRMQKAELLEEYHQKFKEVLPVEKVVRVYVADYDFKAYLLNKIKNKEE
ncbi:MAG: hypothetical protein ACLFT4_03995 [Bacteroidales bacterium]